jgi:hypothetical protein
MSEGALRDHVFYDSQSLRRTHSGNSTQCIAKLAGDCAGCEVLLFGDDAGAAEAAQELNIRHIPIGKPVPEDPKPLRVLFCEAQ